MVNNYYNKYTLVFPFLFYVSQTRWGWNCRRRYRRSTSRPPRRAPCSARALGPPRAPGNFKLSGGALHSPTAHFALSPDDDNSFTTVRLCRNFHFSINRSVRNTYLFYSITLPSQYSSSVN
jgi:hypothetical protein